MGHDHHHNQAGKNLKLAFFLNLAFTILEIIGGLYVNSIAIISDAVHDLGDSLSLGTAWFLNNKSKQAPDKKFSFGYARFSLLGALFNCSVLILGSIYVLSEAISRIQNPEPSNAKGMMFFAFIGIAVNAYAAWKLRSGKTLNERVVSWHLIEDVLGWSAILIVSITLQFWNNLYLDPILSIIISLFILWNVFKNLKETLFLFLQGTPRELNLGYIESLIVEIEKVHSIHHTHIWSLEGEQHVFSTHVKLKNIQSFQDIVNVKKEIKDVLKRFSFKHYTIETELEKELCELYD